jgi:hypothetical protein
MQTKICTKCKRELPVSNFPGDKRRLYGVGSCCKDCKREYRLENKEKWLKTQYERIASDLTIVPKRKIWNGLYYALKTGKLTKPEYCSVCQRWIGTDKIQAHHKDYEKLFEIIWCCQDCHVELDKVRREAEYAKQIC